MSSPPISGGGVGRGAPRPPVLPSGHDLLRIVAFVVVVRALLFAWGAAWTFGEVPFYEMWMRWDADSYLTLAREGYAAPEQSQDRREFMSRFPPLVPWAIGVVAAILRVDPFVAGIVLGIASLAGASVLLWMLAREIGFDRREAWRAVVLLNLFPVSYFGNSVFSEPLFLLLLAAYFLLVARGAGLESRAVALGLALLTRTVAVVLYPIHLVHAWRAHLGGLSAARSLVLLVAPVVPLLLKELWTSQVLGLSGYGSDHAANLRITDPVPFLEQLGTLRTLLTDPSGVDGHLLWTEIYPGVFLLGAVVICASGWRRLPAELNAFSVFYLGLLSLLRFNISGPRYCWPLLPLYLVLATAGPRTFRIAAVGFVAGLLYFTSVFVMGDWAF